MTALADILSAAIPIDGGFRMTIPADWLQGRTAYGGLSSAMALHAAKASDVDLPPLRSALVAFVGPLSGEVTVTAERLRRGRNAAFIEATIRSEKGIGYRATFVFMADVAVPHDPTTSPPRSTTSRRPPTSNSTPGRRSSSPATSISSTARRSWGRPNGCAGAA